MSSFDSIGDSAFGLKTEGQEIKLSFKQGVPTTGQGTVEWNIPAPAAGCQSGSDGEYAGIVVLLSTEPLNSSNIPQDGTVYVADPTADFDLSTADKINNALVIGAFYECELKAQGGILSTSLIVSDLKQGTAYYVGAYATDCQYRYHSDGVRAYSDSYGDKETHIAAKQVVNLGSNGGGVLPTDGTGLIPGIDYEFDLIIDDTFPVGSNVKTVNVTIDGINAGTYQDLLNQINQQILLVDNPQRSPIPPQAGAFFWDVTTQQLYQFDGVSYNLVDALVEATDPGALPVGSYWYDETNKVLNRWNVPNPTGWNVINHIESESDPTNPACDLYWFDNTIARKWDSTTWCDTTTLISLTDPSDCPTVECGTYWYDETNTELLAWDNTNNIWTATTAIFWSEALNSLSDDTYWFDDTNNKLFVRAADAWSDITGISLIQETEPTAPVDGLLWYKTSTEELKQYSLGMTSWVAVDVLVWSEDPTVVESCDLWWDSINDLLFKWDIVNNQWDQVVRFVQSTIDPSEATAIVVNTVWYNPTTDIMSRWTGGDWVVVEHIVRAIDPTQQTVAEAWFNPSTNEWNIWGLPTAGWNSVDPVDSVVDPSNIPNGIYWYDTTNGALYVRNGLTWTVVTFSTVPFSPTRNSQWYDTSTETLYTWSGSAWIEAVPCAVAEFNENGGMTFTTKGLGSNNVILIPTPENSKASTSPCSIGTGYAFNGVNDLVAGQCEYYSNSVTKVYDARDIPNNSFLWGNLSITPNVLTPAAGNDGKSGVPSYMELGVGDDGSPDERRELMDSIRKQLGYPVVQVELTNYQLDTCIQAALESYRKRAGASVRRGFFFLDIKPGTQKYHLTNKVLGYNKITNIMAAYRFTSAFLSSAHGAGVYGQVVLQHLYNMGTYDLTSFHLVSQYVEQLEHLFATRLTFGWHEHNRQLSLYNSFTRDERILLDCMTERTEQDLLKDRISKSWIERYALSEAMFMLSHIRGKFASLPGAGGGISLNAGELITLAQSYRDELINQIEEYVADTPEDVGLHSTFILG